VLYALLRNYKKYLSDIRELQPATANTYYKRLCILLEGQNLTETVKKLDVNKILNKLNQIQHKNLFSQNKNAFLYFCECQNIVLSADTLEIIKELEQQTKKKYRSLKIIDFKKIDEIIKNLKNTKLKLCYQVMLATGLRVSEISGITPADCMMGDDSIVFSIVGKGSKKDTVVINAIGYSEVFQCVKTQIENTPPSKRVFFSTIHLQTKAQELGFKCHDLRRIFAKAEYVKSGSKTAVMKKLRHSNVKTTNIYLKSKIKF
jgi:site-specific recombinase XerC